MALIAYKLTVISGIIQSANKLNGNRRVYSKKILERETESYQKATKERRVVGGCVEAGECYEEGSELRAMVKRLNKCPR